VSDRPNLHRFIDIAGFLHPPLFHPILGVFPSVDQIADVEVSPSIATQPWSYFEVFQLMWSR